MRVLEGRWLILGVFSDEAKVRAEAFDAVELGVLWADIQLSR